MIRLAGRKDVERLAEYDRHISKQELENSIYLKRVYIAEEKEELIGSDIICFGIIHFL